MLERYLIYYNTARRHSSIGDDYPADWYRAGKEKKRGSKRAKHI